MDPQDNPQNITPHRPQPGRQVSDFAPRPARPAHVLDLRPTAAPQPMEPIARPGTPQPHPPQAPDLTPSRLAPPPAPDEIPTGNKPSAIRKNRNGHAWLVGVVLAVILSAFALLPVLSGKILVNFPGSSDSVSTGDQAIACATTPTSPRTATHYDHTYGFPFVYSYATTTTLTADCQGNTQTAVGGHTSQFNPIAGVVDVAVALVLATVIALGWAAVARRRN